MNTRMYYSSNLDYIISTLVRSEFDDDYDEVVKLITTLSKSLTCLESYNQISHNIQERLNLNVFVVKYRDYFDLILGSDHHTLAIGYPFTIQPLAELGLSENILMSIFDTLKKITPSTSDSKVKYYTQILNNTLDNIECKCIKYTNPEGVESLSLTIKDLSLPEPKSYKLDTKEYWEPLILQFEVGRLNLIPTMELIKSMPKPGKPVTDTINLSLGNKRVLGLVKPKLTAGRDRTL